MAKNNIPDKSSSTITNTKKDTLSKKQAEIKKLSDSELIEKTRESLIEFKKLFML